jgi:hypothetical protein
MLLPDPLPTDPDELDALYEKFMSQDSYSQDDFERLMEARLRAWGMDPDNMTTAELLGAMQESMNRMLLNLHMAIGVAPDEESEKQLTEVIGMAEKLRDDIERVIHGGDHLGEAPPPAAN